MIPLNRKERYLNQIVGWGNTAPEKPQTPEEFFFSAILGEDVQLPDLKNATRYELFLAKIAGININISPPTYTSPRIEFFLARVAGMNVPELVPLTREEIFWSNYVAVVEKILEGLRPLTFKAKKSGTLKNYRIYGQTVDGESVGDRTGNLFDENATSTINGYIDSAYINQLGGTISESIYAVSEYIFIPEGANMITVNVPVVLYTPGICFYGNDKQYISGAAYELRSVATEPIPVGAKYLRFTITKQYAHTIMLNLGSTALPYEPYGYKVPVTVEGKNLLQNTATSQTINGITFTVNEDGSVTCNGTASNTTLVSLDSAITLLPNTEYIFSGCIGGTSSASYRIDLRTSDKTVIKDINNAEIRCYNGEFTFKVDENIVATPYIRIASGYNCENVIIKPMIRLASIEDDTYEPYQTPVTTNLYLPEQIRKVGNEAEYIDYGEQKFHRISGADLDVTLPALPTVTGTNVLSVGTEVQPSNVYIEYEGVRDE